MAPISTRTHGMLDYALAPALLAAPKLLRIEDSPGASLAPRAIGAIGALYAPLSDHELAVKRVLPMRAHLALDAVGGLALAASPWLLGFAWQGRRYWLPHVVVGLTQALLAAATEREPATA